MRVANFVTYQLLKYFFAGSETSSTDFIILQHCAQLQKENIDASGM